MDARPTTSRVFVVQATGADRSDGGHLTTAVNTTAWTSQLKSSIFIVSAGEKRAWPEVIEMMQKFEMHVVEDDQFQVVTDLLGKYPSWQKQCRPGSLQFKVVGPVVKWWEQVTTDKLGSGKEIDQLIEDDKSVELLLSQFRDARRLEWPDVDSLLAQMEPAAVALSTHSCQNLVVEQMGKYLEDGIDKAETNELVTYLQEFQRQCFHENTKVQLKGEAASAACKTPGLLAQRLLLIFPSEVVTQKWASI